MWNQRRYDAGFKACHETLTTKGLAAARAEYDNLDGARAVDEYEVGFRRRLEAELVPA